MIQRLIAWLCARLAKRCRHPPEQVTFDITEGALGHVSSMYPGLNWCRCCGAYRFVHEESASEWRTPETYGDNW
jgi:hypothetical protein